RRGEAPDPGAGRGGSGRDPQPGPGGHPVRGRPRPGRPPAPGRGAVDRARREDRRAQPRSRHAARARRELYRPGRQRQRKRKREPVTGMAESERVEAYAQAFYRIARAEQQGTAVEDDLFRFARALEANDELRGVLGDPSLPAERRIAVVEELMGGVAMPVSVGLVSMVVGSERAGELPAVVDRFLDLSAAERRHDVAEVRAAMPLDDRLRQRLAK